MENTPLFFKEGNELEAQLLLLVQIYQKHPESPEEGNGKVFSEKLATLSASYTKALNQALNEYAPIDYFTDAETKIQAKARINFSYDLLSLLITIIRDLDAIPPPISHLFDCLKILEEKIKSRPAIVKEQYLAPAQAELETFYGTDIRRKLDEALQRIISAHRTPKPDKG